MRGRPGSWHTSTALLWLLCTRDRLWTARHIITFFVRQGSGGGGRRRAVIVSIKVNIIVFFLLRELHIADLTYVEYDKAVSQLKYCQLLVLSAIVTPLAVPSLRRPGFGYILVGCGHARFPFFTISILSSKTGRSSLGTTVARNASFFLHASYYGHARSHRRASARRGEAPLVSMTYSVFLNNTFWEGAKYLPTEKVALISPILKFPL